MDICGNDLFVVIDKSILLVLLNTEIRANELKRLNIEDINPVTVVMVM